ncbi:hypothetical protein E2542_SST30438 [Spatholobus suberectus]|nr:hypothetical protein E2542_SST30438 [Spatholobus suberectus]
MGEWRNRGERRRRRRRSICFLIVHFNACFAGIVESFDIVMSLWLTPVDVALLFRQASADALQPANNHREVNRWSNRHPSISAAIATTQACIFSMPFR